MSVQPLDATHKTQKGHKTKKKQIFYTRYGKMVQLFHATGVRDHSTFSWPQRGGGIGGEECIFVKSLQFSK